VKSRDLLKVSVCDKPREVFGILGLLLLKMLKITVVHKLLPVWTPGYPVVARHTGLLDGLETPELV
jgi:hypothetical protein